MKPPLAPPNCGMTSKAGSFTCSCPCKWRRQTPCQRGKPTSSGSMSASATWLSQVLRREIVPFPLGKRIVAKANHYARLRKRLQKKGTRSATRRLMAISGRERRLKQDANHVVSKRIVEAHPHSLIGLENLTDIRERTRRPKGKRATHKQRKANTAYAKWAFAELQSMMAYKALLHGSMAVKIDASHT